MGRSVSNPLALGMILVGAATMTLATFLPLDEPTGLFRMVRDNTLIQSGGWLLIAVAIGIAAAGFRASQKPGQWVAPVVLCVLAAGGVTLWFLDTSMRTLYPIGADGTPDTSQPGTVAALGIALYVAGAGVAIALVGSLMLRQSAHGDPDSLEAAWSAAPTKKCTDCAETILADAKVCKHCGYRFAVIAPSGPQVPSAPEPAVRQRVSVKCFKCQHSQSVPAEQQTFTCEQCGAKLKRQPRTKAS
jgi:hypothetical protein